MRCGNLGPRARVDPPADSDVQASHSLPDPRSAGLGYLGAPLTLSRYGSVTAETLVTTSTSLTLWIAPANSTVT